MADYDKIKELALESGFTHVGDLDADLIEVRTEVRDMCAEDKCKSYGKNWSCPPGCGSLSECEDKIRKYKKGFILQTTGELEDSFDFESMTEINQKHGKAIAELAKKVGTIYPDAMVLGAGACTLCKDCTYPDQPCRFPDKMIASMEAYGIVVSDICSANNIAYYYGPNTLTYVGCVLID